MNLNDRVTQLQLSSGTLLIHIRRLDDDETYEIDTPNLAFSVLRVGTYRLTVDATGNTTLVSVIRGQGEVTGRRPRLHGVQQPERQLLRPEPTHRQSATFGPT